MSYSLSTGHMRRYKELARFLIKYGALRHARPDRTRKGIGREQLLVEKNGAKAEELSEDLEKMGPTYVKLGQFLSTRSDLLAPQYIEALARLQDSTERFAYEKVEEIVSSELGMPVSGLFSFSIKSLLPPHLSPRSTGRSCLTADPSP